MEVSGLLHAVAAEDDDGELLRCNLPSVKGKQWTVNRHTIHDMSALHPYVLDVFTSTVSLRFSFIYSPKQRDVITYLPNRRRETKTTLTSHNPLYNSSLAFNNFLSTDNLKPKDQ